MLQCPDVDQFYDELTLCILTTIKQRSIEQPAAEVTAEVQVK